MQVFEVSLNWQMAKSHGRHYVFADAAIPEHDEDLERKFLWVRIVSNPQVLAEGKSQMTVTLHQGKKKEEKMFFPVHSLDDWHGTFHFDVGDIKFEEKPLFIRVRFLVPTVEGIAPDVAFDDRQKDALEVFRSHVPFLLVGFKNNRLHYVYEDEDMSDASSSEDGSDSSDDESKADKAENVVDAKAEREQGTEEKMAEE